jgi:hypothetical protein
MVNPVPVGPGLMNPNPTGAPDLPEGDQSDRHGSGEDHNGPRETRLSHVSGEAN